MAGRGRGRTSKAAANHPLRSTYASAAHAEWVYFDGALSDGRDRADRHGVDAVLHELEQFSHFLSSEGGPSLLALVLLGVFIVPLVVWVHELGHALVAMRLLDAEVELTVGSVGKVLEAQWGSLQVRVNALGGKGQVSLDAARVTARDMLLISLAGPAASACGLVLTAVALAWVPPGVVHDALWVAMLFSVAATLSVVPLAVSRAAPARRCARTGSWRWRRRESSASFAEADLRRCPREPFTATSHRVCQLVTESRGLRAILYHREMQTNKGAPMIPVSTTRVDLHCHSTASQLSKLGIQRALGLPECATPPEEVYELAKRRGMDFVTITDHDTIAGVLEISDRPDVFLSEELTARFKGEPQAVHVLCYGITPADHQWLQAHAEDVEACAEYLHEGGITCALAHPFYAVDAPLQPRHRRRLAQLFPVWETRNGSRAKELNMPAAIYIETHGGTGVGGSDDHAGVDIGRTFTETPAAATPEELLAHIRAGRAEARGEQGSAAKWAHAAMGLAARVLARDANGEPDPEAVLRMVERVVSEGDARQGGLVGDLGPDDARNLLASWLDSVDFDLPGDELLAHLQGEDFSHADLYRRARRAHERKLRCAVGDTLTAAATGGDYAGAARGLFDACIPAIPYVPATLFLGREKGKLAARDGEPRRVALIADAVGGMHGVTHTLDEIRERGLDGFEIEVVGTDPNVDRRLPAVAEVPIPFYPGLQIGVPSLPAITEAIAEGRYDVVHLVSPGPAGVAAALLARIAELPVIGSYHTELAAYAGLRSGDELLEAGMGAALGAFYGACRVVLSPSESADASLQALGIPEERLGRWDRGVDVSRFDPGQRVEGLYPGELNVLYAGRLTKEKGVDLLADAFLAARERDPRLHLILAGGGPEEAGLRERLGDHATFLGWLEGEELAQAYASADLFLFASATDTFGQVILEAQASGLPVIAVARGGPLTLIRDGITGRLCPPDARSLTNAVVELAAAPRLRRRLAAAALVEVRARTWDRSLTQLADGYRRALGPELPAELRRAA